TAQTVDLTFTSVPAGLSVAVDGTSDTTPFTRTVIRGSSNSVSAPSPQAAGANTFDFTSWSDGGAATHNLTASASTTLTARFTFETTPWWNTAWTRRRLIVFDRGPRSTDLVNFPVLVVLDPGRIDYASAKAGGADLRFIDADGTTVLSHEIERWTPGGQSFVWVKVPKLDAASTSDFIWMYYGNAAAADGQSVSAVWNNGHRGVWHLGAAAVSDSTGLGHAGTDVGSVVGTGKMGSGRQFNGTSARVTVADAADL